jgi:putative NADH-flavin reductase
MNIIIFGASGKTGHHLVRQALEQGYTVTAFVRDPAKLTAKHEQLKVVQGNVSDYSTTEQAIKGQDAVLSALGANNPFKYDQAVVDGMSNIIKAMKSTGVKKLIYLSFVGVKESRKDAGFVISYIAPKILKPEIAGHEAREKMIRQSQLDWTIVQAPTLTNGPLKQKYRSGVDLRTKAFIITLSRADVADFMLKQLIDDRYICKTARIM